MVRIFKILSLVAFFLSCSPGFSMGSKPGVKEVAPAGDASSLSPKEAIFLRQGFSKIVKPLLPSVVNISTATEIKAPESLVPDIPLDSPLGEVINRYLKEYQKQQRLPQKSRSLGSGFIIEYNKKEKIAYIATNNHIVNEADEIFVRLADEDSLELKADVVGKDERTDIALLKVKVSEAVPVLEWGNSDDVEVGEWSIAIGNPFGLGGTVTSGILSSKSRQLPIADYVTGYLQTDAAINFGNSGGPLLNVNGKVIGINAAILAPGGGNVGIGFAIPSNVAIKVIKQLRTLGHTKRGWLGAAVQPVTKEIAESIGLKRPVGALIARVFEKSPAKEAGLEVGDVILNFNGQVVKSSQELPHIVGETEIGKDVEVVVWRDEQEVRKSLKVGEFEKAEKEGLIDAKSRTHKSNKSSGVEVMGMTLQPIDEGNRREFNLDSKAKGVVITRVKDYSDAAEKGLRAGDILTEVGREPVLSPEDVKEKLEKAKQKNRKSILLLVSRHGEVRFLTLMTEEKKRDSSKEEESGKSEDKKLEDSD